MVQLKNKALLLYAMKWHSDLECHLGLTCLRQLRVGVIIHQVPKYMPNICIMLANMSV